MKVSSLETIIQNLPALNNSDLEQAEIQLIKENRTRSLDEATFKKEVLKIAIFNKCKSEINEFFSFRLGNTYFISKINGDYHEIQPLNIGREYTEPVILLAQRIAKMIDEIPQIVSYFHAFSKLKNVSKDHSQYDKIFKQAIKNNIAPYLAEDIYRRLLSDLHSSAREDYFPKAKRITPENKHLKDIFSEIEIIDPSLLSDRDLCKYYSEAYQIEARKKGYCQSSTKLMQGLEVIATNDEVVDSICLYFLTPYTLLHTKGIICGLLSSISPKSKGESLAIYNSVINQKNHS